MNLDKLKAFIVVAEELNFTKSAERLAMSQPPLTRLIAGLEKELGVALFERTTRQVRLTPAGVLLLKEAREITGALSRIESEVKQTAKLKKGAVRIGFSATAYIARFPVIVEEFKRHFPAVVLDLQQDSTNEVLAGVAQGRFDIGFVESVESSEGLTAHKIHDEVLGVLLPKKHRLSLRKEISFDELSEETLILHSKEEAQEFHRRITKLVGRLKKKPQIYIKSPNEGCPILVATGKGVSLTIANTQRLVPDQTVFVPLKNMFLPVTAFWKNENPSSSFRVFLSFVLENHSLKPFTTECLFLGKA